MIKLGLYSQFKFCSANERAESTQRSQLQMAGKFVIEQWTPLSTWSHWMTCQNKFGQNSKCWANNKNWLEMSNINWSQKTFIIPSYFHWYQTELRLKSLLCLNLNKFCTFFFWRQIQVPGWQWMVTSLVRVVDLLQYQMKYYWYTTWDNTWHKTWFTFTLDPAGSSAHTQ